jgi:hypothetical protein
MFNRLSGVQPSTRVLTGGSYNARIEEDYYFVTAADQTIVLPASPTEALTYLVLDSTGVASPAHPITIDGNGKTIGGAATLTITAAHGCARLIFDLTSNGWTIANYNDAPTTPSTLPVQYVTGAAYAVTPNDSSIVVNNAVSPVTITLPAAPNDGKVITVTDGGGNASTQNITIDGNGKNVNGNPTLVLAIGHAVQRLIYSAGLGAWAKG